ncbi:hypothetical protein HAX54_025781 [Datura stramonium]|uniref:Uncharacterized protein n=1 Tax=Datura stramonium TaxID=4076 RepID=A0ABS8S6S1_DATST|nr:hypothetical protein [Datura stramonium]
MSSSDDLNQSESYATVLRALKGDAEPSTTTVWVASALGSSSPKRQKLDHPLLADKSKESSSFASITEGDIRVLGETDCLFMEADLVEMVDSYIPIPYDPVIIGTFV